MKQEGSPLSDKPFSRKEEQKLLDSLGQVLARDFPNPERVGCPGPAVLTGLASRKLSLAEAEPWMEHLGSCTACFREYTELRKQVVRRRRNTYIAAAAIVIIVACIGSWAGLRKYGKEKRVYAQVVVDLRNRLVLRGDEASGPAQGPLTLLEGVNAVSFYLPPGSRATTYEIGVFEELGKPVASATGTASISNGVTVLKVKLNLSTVSRGHYLLGMRLPGMEWSYYPLVVK